MPRAVLGYLRRRDDNLAVARRDEVVVYAEQVPRLGTRLFGLRQVQVHLIAVEVRVVRRADAPAQGHRLDRTGLHGGIKTKTHMKRNVRLCNSI